MAYEESVSLLNEVRDFVREYTGMHGAMPLKVMSIHWGRRIKRIEGITPRQYVNKHMDHFVMTMNKLGGIKLLLKDAATNPDTPSGGDDVIETVPDLVGDDSLDSI